MTALALSIVCMYNSPVLYGICLCLEVVYLYSYGTAGPTQGGFLSQADSHEA